ncbi:MAG: ATP-dependent DNA ligase [Planctomycetes bacterium]|nr:ATP-dependent DNA ligase [Planctomycetota bacterium]
MIAVGQRRSLPSHVPPMLALSGRPFDSPLHLFEVKWDGVRAVSYIEGGTLRMHGRRRRDLATRYPELDFLAGLGNGLVLDGELVVLQPDGRADFRAVLARENAGAAGVAAAARRHPVVYIVFDLLYEHGEPLLELPLRERRARLAQVVASSPSPRLSLSAGVEGHGLSLFAAVRERGLEGIVGKRLDSPYRPGERGDAWLKIKPVHSVHCLILGYEPDAARGFKSLIIASDFDGALRCVGKVGSGIGEAERTELRRLLAARRCERPLLDAGVDGVWVTPGLYCTVNYLERTPSGALRAPVFVALLPEALA